MYIHTNACNYIYIYIYTFSIIMLVLEISIAFSSFNPLQPKSNLPTLNPA